MANKKITDLTDYPGGVFELTNEFEMSADISGTFASRKASWSDIKTSVTIQSVVSSATVTPLVTDDEVIITAQAVGLTLANPSGTAVQGQVLMIRIKDDATTRAITYGSEYRAIGVTLPTTTTVSKTHYLGMIYNATDTKWDVIGVNEEA
jgi:hypothetical protein